MDLRPNMIVATDITNKDNVAVIKAETILTSDLITKVKTLGRDFVAVVSYESNKPYFNTGSAVTAPKPQDKPLHIPPAKPNEIFPKPPIAATKITEQEEFLTFEKTYEEKKQVVKKYISDISDGATDINITEMSSVTIDVMRSLKNKSDVFTFLGFIKTADEHTYTHSNNVSLLCNLFAHWLKLSENETIQLTAAGILHDIGKTKIPSEIINKKGKLTDAEFDLMKTHTTVGYDLLKPLDISEDIKMTALMHHERIDGRGYPEGLPDEKINKFAKIVKICDIYDAMTANRAYRDRICPFDVIKTFETKVYGEVDTHFLFVFLKNIAYNYIGTWAVLNDGSNAEVIYINPKNLSRPMLRKNTGEIIDLTTHNDVTIEHII
jgi:putative nucleotidyltransferase with HDIG domain